MALVAKSYENLKQVGDVYTVNGKMYIKVEMGNGNLKQVRVYSEKEYARYYGIPVEKTASHKPLKEVLGFVDDYITIFKGNTYSYKEWFKGQGARYHKLWGWSFASNEEVPELPSEITAIRLDWSAVSDDDETLKPDSVIKSAVEALTFSPSNSQFQGEVGQRLELEVLITRALLVSGAYGTSMCYTMVDEDENEYVWFTSSAKTQFKEGEQTRIRGTVKGHKSYRNSNQTLLTRCVKVGKK